MKTTLNQMVEAEKRAFSIHKFRKSAESGTHFARS